MTERIGEFLVRIGAMMPKQVEEVLTVQKNGDRRPFGEIANALGFVGDDSIKRFADYLEKSRSEKS